MQNNYDRIANYYDMFSRLVFFRSQVKAQIEQLKYIPPNSNVLIAGGGTGWILDEIAKIHPAGLDITYVEISKKMLALSQKRNTGANTIEYIRTPIEEFKHHKTYEVIITAFLFDNFSEERAVTVFKQLDNSIKRKGLWLFTDFYDDKNSSRKWQLYLLKMMYLFFKHIANVEAISLAPMNAYFKEKGYKPLAQKYYYGRFIKSTVYEKQRPCD